MGQGLGLQSHNRATNSGVRKTGTMQSLCVVHEIGSLRYKSGENGEVNLQRVSGRLIFQQKVPID